MLPWKLLDSTIAPRGEELRLYRRGEEYSIRVGNAELMNSRVHASEVALAEIACERLGDRSRPRILIGGLGLGFTLAAVLQRVGRRSEVIVAELIPAVVAWNRREVGEIAGRPLDDPRVVVREADVSRVIREASGGFDAILLDVDNGPRGLTVETNDWLYGRSGLRAIYDALRSGGLLAVWSSGPDAAFTRRLRQGGFETEELRVRGRGAAGGPRYLIWIARRQLESAPLSHSRKR